MVRAAAVLLFVIVASCRQSAEDGPVRPAGSWVVLRSDGRPTARVRVKVVREEQERQRGLMFVRAMPRDDGMLFIFEKDEIQSFWMRNTYIPLDMIFINLESKVVGVVEHAKPLTDDSRSVDMPSRYVLEVNAGWARENGVSFGTRVEFIGIAL